VEGPPGEDGFVGHAGIFYLFKIEEPLAIE